MFKLFGYYVGRCSDIKASYLTFGGTQRYIKSLTDSLDESRKEFGQLTKLSESLAKYNDDLERQIDDLNRIVLSYKRQFRDLKREVKRLEETPNDRNDTRRPSTVLEANPSSIYRDCDRSPAEGSKESEPGFEAGETGS